MMQIAPTVGTFLVRGNVFRTAFSMMSRLQGQVIHLKIEKNEKERICVFMFVAL
jgi:hypothetical protein